MKNDWGKTPEIATSIPSFLEEYIYKEKIFEWTMGNSTLYNERKNARLQPRVLYEIASVLGLIDLC